MTFPILDRTGSFSGSFQGEVQSRVLSRSGYSSHLVAPLIDNQWNIAVAAVLCAGGSWNFCPLCGMEFRHPANNQVPSQMNLLSLDPDSGLWCVLSVLTVLYQGVCLRDLNWSLSDWLTCSCRHGLYYNCCDVSSEALRLGSSVLTMFSFQFLSLVISHISLLNDEPSLSRCFADENP